MASFIVDMNVPVKSNQVGYPAYFFDEMNQTNRHHVYYGGTTYLAELRKKEALQKIFINWLTVRKATRLQSSAVDEFEESMKSRVLLKLGSCPEECDDFHIFAISAVSGCKNVLSFDQRMSTCKAKIRNRIGHEYCPDLRFIKSRSTYKSACRL